VPEPFMTTLGVAIAAGSVAAVGIGVMVFFKKRKH